MKVHYFNQEKADSDDLMLRMCIDQGYVPSKCLLSGNAVFGLVQEGSSPCVGCNGPKERCRAINEKTQQLAIAVRCWVWIKGHTMIELKYNRKQAKMQAGHEEKMLVSDRCFGAWVLVVLWLQCFVLFVWCVARLWEIGKSKKPGS